MLFFWTLCSKNPKKKEEEIFLEHQNKVLQLFLKDHVTLPSQELITF